MKMSAVRGTAVFFTIAGAPVPGTAVSAFIKKSAVPGTAVRFFIPRTALPGKWVPLFMKKTAFPGTADFFIIAQSPVPGTGVRAMVNATPFSRHPPRFFVVISAQPRLRNRVSPSRRRVPRPAADSLIFRRAYSLLTPGYGPPSCSFGKKPPPPRLRPRHSR